MLDVEDDQGGGDDGAPPTIAGWELSKEDDWQPPQRPDCACHEHLEDVLTLVIPSRDWDEDPTFEQLLATGSLGAADEIYGCYEDDAVLPFDRSIAAQPGVELVDWYDREEFLIGAPGLCESGMLAAIARALQDPRVRVKVS